MYTFMAKKRGIEIVLGLKGGGGNFMKFLICISTLYMCFWMVPYSSFVSDPGGYIDVKDLLDHQMFKGYSIDDIRNVVASNDKQRFTLRNNPSTWKLQICANQGHSFEVSRLSFLSNGKGGMKKLVLQNLFMKTRGLNLIIYCPTLPVLLCNH